mmetsp:Transcript_1869/g.6628  ORF Transcript_1869/g.6628 Transcript_1869/m.6628 type:complete len:670 (-) Transcript_1869:30-2039(-)
MDTNKEPQTHNDDASKRSLERSGQRESIEHAGTIQEHNAMEIDSHVHLATSQNGGNAKHVSISLERAQMAQKGTPTEHEDETMKHASKAHQHTSPPPPNGAHSENSPHSNLEWNPENIDTLHTLCGTLFDIFLEDTVHGVVEAKTQQMSESLSCDTVMRRRIREYQQDCLPKTKRKMLLAHTSNSEETDDEDDHWESRSQTSHGYNFGLIPPREVLLHSDMPLDEFTHRVTAHMDQIYQQYAWKLEWHNLQQSVLRRHLLDLAEQVDAEKMSDASFETYSPCIPTDDQLRSHPMFASHEGALTISLDGVDEFDLAAALQIHDKDAYLNSIKEAQEKARQIKEQEKSSFSRGASTRARRRKNRATEDGAPKIHEEEEVIIPAFRIVNQEAEDIITEDIDEPDEYGRVISLLKENNKKLTIMDLAGDVYPYQIHMHKELKEKRRIWRCWHGGSFRDPEDMTEEEREIYKEKEKEMPVMPEFKVVPESYLFAPVPTSSSRGNYESMKVKAAAFWKKKAEDDKKKRDEEAEKRNRKKRKRKTSTIYKELPSDEEEFLMVAKDDDFVCEEATLPKKRGRGRPPKSASRGAAESTTTHRIKRRKTSTRSSSTESHTIRLTLESEESIPDEDLFVEPPTEDMWQLTENTGSWMHWKDALAGNASFILRFQRIATPP